MRLRLPGLVLLAMPLALACDRAKEGADPSAEAQALRAATEELAAARAAFEADRATLQQDVSALRKAVEALDAKLGAQAAERPSPPVTGRPPLPMPALPPFDPSKVPLLGDAGGGPPLEEAAVAAAVRCEAETRCTIDGAFVETLRINPASLAKQARVVPSLKDGVVQGYKLYAIRPGSLPKALGFKNGDLVRSINGFELASMDKVLEVYAKLRHEKSFQVAIDRKGVPLVLAIEIVGP